MQNKIKNKNKIVINSIDDRKSHTIKRCHRKLSQIVKVPTALISKNLMVLLHLTPSKMIIKYNDTEKE